MDIAPLRLRTNPLLTPKVNKENKNMEKSYNDIKAQEQRVMALCLESGRWCDNAKNRFDTQHLAQITRNTLTQHGFPIFGQYDKDEKRSCVHHEQEHKPEPIKEQEPEHEPVAMVVEEQKPTKKVEPTPTEQAHERVALEDWMNADVANRKKIQDAARHQFINKMYADLLGDMEICKLEGWDVLEYPRMLRDAISRIFPQPKQLTLQFT